MKQHWQKKNVRREIFYLFLKKKNYNGWPKMFVVECTWHFWDFRVDRLHGGGRKISISISFFVYSRNVIAYIDLGALSFRLLSRLFDFRNRAPVFRYFSPLLQTLFAYIDLVHRVFNHLFEELFLEVKFCAYQYNVKAAFIHFDFLISSLLSMSVLVIIEYFNIKENCWIVTRSMNLNFEPMVFFHRTLFNARCSFFCLFIN